MKIDLDKLYWDMDADTDNAILKGIDAVPVVEEPAPKE